MKDYAANEEAGNNEKYVDTDITAGNETVQMKSDDGENRKRSQSVDVRTICHNRIRRGIDAQAEAPPAIRIRSLCAHLRQFRQANCP